MFYLTIRQNLRVLNQNMLNSIGIIEGFRGPPHPTQDGTRPTATHNKTFPQPSLLTHQVFKMA